MTEERMIDVDRKCPICGKVFGVLDADKWAYKDGKPMKYFCSWTCLRKWQKEHTKPQKELVIEEEPARRTQKDRRPPMGSQQLIKMILKAIEDGDDPTKMLEKMGYVHWKKWHSLKKWAEKHDPDLRSRMPESLGVDMRRKENRKKAEENLVGGTRTTSVPDVPVSASLKCQGTSNPENGSSITFSAYGKLIAEEKPQPDIEVIAVRTEMGEFAKHGDAINWIYGSGTAAMHAELTPEEWKDFTREIVPAAMEKLGEEQ